MPRKQAKPKADRALHPVEQVDLEVARTVHVGGKRSLPARILCRYAELGDQPPLAALSGAVAAAGLVTGNRKLVRTGLRMLAAHALATALKGAIKDRVDRTRPGVAIEKRRYRLARGKSREGRLRSMPSGHSAGLAAVGRAFAREYPDTAIPVTLAAGSVALAQLPSGNHFVSDVTAGTALGIAAEATVAALMGPIRDLGQPLRSAGVEPGVSGKRARNGLHPA